VAPQELEKRMIVERLVVGPLQVNCYLVAHPETREAIIVDPGDDPDRISARVRELGLKPLRIVNTHCHFDHVLGVQALKEEFGIPFWIPRGEEGLVQVAPQVALEWLGTAPGPAPEVDALIAEGQNIAPPGLTLVVHEAPGHSPNGCVFVGEGVCFSGDVVFAGSIGRYDLPGADFNTLMRSIRRIFLPLPDETIIYPGHGPPTTMGQERRWNPFIQALLGA